MRPTSPFKFGHGRFPDGVSRDRDRVYERFLQVRGRPVLARAWSLPRFDGVAIAAMPAPAAWLDRQDHEVATGEDLEVAIGRMRNALAVDDDLTPFHRRFARDPLLGPLIRRMPWYRVRRCPNPWEAFAWAVTAQLIESRSGGRYSAPCRQELGERAQLRPGRDRPLADVPGA